MSSHEQQGEGWAPNTCTLEVQPNKQINTESGQAHGYLGYTRGGWNVTIVIWHGVYFISHYIYIHLGGGNSNICCFHPENWGRWTQFDLSIFFRWVGGSTTNQEFFLGSMLYVQQGLRILPRKKCSKIFCWAKMVVERFMCSVFGQQNGNNKSPYQPTSIPRWWNSNDLFTWPMANLLNFGDSIFSRENKVQTFISVSIG